MSSGVLDQLRVPVVQAPMAGGPSTPALAVAVSEAGGLGFLAAGYRTAAAVRDDIVAVRAATDRPFGVNLFVPTPDRVDRSLLAGYVERVRREAVMYRCATGDAVWGDDGWEEKLAMLVVERPPVVSVAFGCPGAEVIGRLHGAGIEVWVTVTELAEAKAAAAADADALVAQGIEAGAHRSAFSDVDGVGEIGLLTRAFSGRRARGIVNGFLARNNALAPAAYPHVVGLTAPLRSAARERDDPEMLNLWAGQAYTAIDHGVPAAHVVERIGREIAEALGSD
jgi:NAD(P)H-dependent flavin oxidoreductase YrpB (nitropropane dioxygenase family)